MWDAVGLFRERTTEFGLLWWLSCCCLGQCVAWCRERGGEAVRRNGIEEEKE